MIDNRKLSTVLNTELKSHGFTKKGSTWYLKKDEIISVLNLQKSNYDNTFFLNIGFWLLKIEDIDTPKQERCHVLSRASSLWPDGNPRVADLLRISDFDCDEKERIAAIKIFIREKLIPLLQEGSTITGLLTLLANHDEFHIQLVARKFLGLELP